MADSVVIGKYFPIDIEEEDIYIKCYTKNYETLDIMHLNNATQINHETIRQIDNAIRLESLVKNIILNKQFTYNQWNMNRTITFCSDGGAKNGKGSFGVSSSIDENWIITNMNRIPEVFNEANSHRSEAFGMLSALCTYNLIYIYIFRKQ
jgi:hypothetical protein